ncbi:MAG: hypothetical protein U5L96_08975 [Owenweeksia sp.]|nr:hypothetical protein [Owenweeksia sp.]
MIRSKYEVQPNDILNITVRSSDEETSKMFNSSGNQNMSLAAGDRPSISMAIPSILRYIYAGIG